MSPQLVVRINAHVPRVAGQTCGHGVDVVDDAFVLSGRRARVGSRPRLDVAVPRGSPDHAVVVAVDALVQLGLADVCDAALTAMAYPHAAVDGNRRRGRLVALCLIGHGAVLAQGCAGDDVDLGDGAALGQCDPDERECRRDLVELQSVISVRRD
jgi:hypothetical protein